MTPEGRPPSCSPMVPVATHRFGAGDAPDEFRRPEDGCLFPVCMVGAAYDFVRSGDSDAPSEIPTGNCDRRAREVVELRGSLLGGGRPERLGEDYSFTEEFNLCAEHADRMRRLDARRLVRDELSSGGVADPGAGPA